MDFAALVRLSWWITINSYSKLCHRVCLKVCTLNLYSGPMNNESTLSRAPLRILALSGGGYRAIFSAQVLANAEQRWKKPISDRFDLIVGTSAGALLAAGIALKIEAAK